MDYERVEGDTEGSRNEGFVCGEFFLRKDVLVGVIWRYDDVEGQYVFVFSCGGE
jgi:hypothetical protein